MLDPGRRRAGGRLTTASFKERYLAEMFCSLSPEQCRRLPDQPLCEALQARLRPEAMQRLRWHRHQGHRVVIVSASPRCLLQSLAGRLGVELIATETTDPTQQTGSHPLRLTSANCKGPEKVRRLEAWLGRPLTGIHQQSYGDSRVDRELLLASTSPHWRSFGPEPVAYPLARAGALRSWIVLLGLGLLLLALIGLARLPGAQQEALLDAGRSLLIWLPAIYGLLGVGYGLRYWRWRLLLGSLAIGSWSRADALAWFRGFALTATPAKLGELSRVQQLHRELGYPRPPLVHVFVAERLADAAAVAGLLVLLAPSQLLGRLPRPPAAITTAAVAFGVAVLLAGVFAGFLGPLWRRWRHHLPSGALARAIPPATAVSVMVWAMEALVLWMLVQVLSPTTISIPLAIGIYLLSGTAGMASTVPGGLGVNEAATVLLLRQQGIPAATGLPIAILRRLITPWSAVALAAILGALSVERKAALFPLRHEFAIASASDRGPSGRVNGGQDDPQDRWLVKQQGTSKKTIFSASA